MLTLDLHFYDTIYAKHKQKRARMGEAILNNNFSNIQMELLKLYATNISDNELKEIKQKLAEFFSQKAINEADKLWDEKQMDDALMTKWIND